MIILNDIHIGFDRKGGTTPASQEALRQYLFESVEDFVQTQLQLGFEKHLCILGDLFDDFEVAPRDWLMAFVILSDWLQYGDHKLTLIAGNHDHSPKAQRVSSFQMLCTVLVEQWGDERVQVVGIDAVKEIEPGVVAVAHCSSQQVFEEKLKEAYDKKPFNHLLLHCNYDNKFAARSDHSLNLTPALASNFVDEDIMVIIAHEHQRKVAMNGKVQILGNQWPTSVADCLGNDEKYAYVLNKVGLGRKDPTWKHDAEAAYNEVPWDLLASYSMSGASASFIRVIGNATAAQAADVINEIAAFRARSSAFVITNAVKVEGMVSPEDLPASFEAAKKFDVMSYVQQHLEPSEYAKVQKLMEEQ